MIRILDERTLKFIDYLNANYTCEKECLLTVLNGVMSLDENGELESAYNDYEELGIIALSTETPEKIIDGNGKKVSQWYYDNYTLLKLAHEYAHHLQTVGIVDNPKDEYVIEVVANDWAHKVVKAFIKGEF